MLLGIVLAMMSAQETPKLLERIEQSGRCVSLAESPDGRVSPLPSVAPAPPPVLSFRLYEGKLHHRYDQSDLMLDDAAH